MDLKYKKEKIRDLVVHQINIIPVQVDTYRHKVVVTVKRTDLIREGLDDLSKSETELTSIIGRKTTLKIKEDVKDE